MKNLKEVFDTLSRKKYPSIEDIKRYYVPYVVNKCYSRVLFSLFYANEMNKYSFIPKEMQYDFYFYGLEKGKYFGRKYDQSEHKYFKSVKRYFEYNDKKTLEVLSILKKEELEYIHQAILSLGDSK